MLSSLCATWVFSSSSSRVSLALVWSCLLRCAIPYLRHCVFFWLQRRYGRISRARTIVGYLRASVAHAHVNVAVRFTYKLRDGRHTEILGKTRHATGNRSCMRNNVKEIFSTNLIINIFMKPHPNRTARARVESSGRERTSEGRRARHE